MRSFEDGEFVVLHHEVNWPNRKAMFEIFWFENGLAAEHWSGIADHPETTLNGHTMLGGATHITDKRLTQKNKEFAASFAQTEMIKNGIPIEIRKVFKVLGEGNFVLVCSEGKFAGKYTAFFDLFRLDNGIIVEHWDALQEIPDKMAHDNGFFKALLYKRIGGYDAIAGFVDVKHDFVEVFQNVFRSVTVEAELGK